MMRRRAAGLALSELMVALAIGLLLILASTTLLMATRSTYLLHDDRARVEESGRYAIDVIGRAVRQAGYRDRSAAGVADGDWPAVSGLDARSLKDAADGIGAPYGAAVNGSDVLALRFDGADEGDAGMQNCAGANVPAGAPGSGWSIFYIAKDSGGEPELRCKYRGASGWKSDALVRGVEDFQVLYGMDSAGDDLPRRFVSATVVEQEAAGWQRVAAVKVALLVRGTQPGSSRGRHYALFGTDNVSDADQGVRISEDDLPAASRGLLRRVYGATLYLRNRTRDRP
jgi:type IV pilus assembly protein PilW